MKHLAAGLFCLLSVFTVAHAATVPTAYRKTAEQYDIPPTIFYAIALQESKSSLTNGQVRPWPWTVRGPDGAHYAKTRADAYNILCAYLRKGIRNVDVGHMQVSWRWQSARLGDPWMALDPYRNMDVAAQYLSELYAKHNDWWVAVGKYHSPGERDDQVRRAKQYALSVKQRRDAYVEQYARLSANRILTFSTEYLLLGNVIGVGNDTLYAHQTLRNKQSAFWRIRFAIGVG